MKTLPSGKSTDGPFVSFFRSIADFFAWCFSNLGFITKCVLIGLIAYATLHVLSLYIGYDLALGYLWGTLGFDKTFAQPIAIFVAVVVIVCGPSLILSILFGVQKRRLVVATAILCSVLLLGTFFFARDVYFSRISGENMQCYAKTLEGFKFSSTCDFDPRSGIQYQKVTPEILEEIHYWQKYGKQESVPPIESGKFFDSLTGKAIVWYAIKPNGAIFLSPLPGFDPATGDQLKPITKAIVEKYNLGKDVQKEVPKEAPVVIPVEKVPVPVPAKKAPAAVVSAITDLLDYDKKIYAAEHGGFLREIFEKEELKAAREEAKKERVSANTEIRKWFFSNKDEGKQEEKAVIVDLTKNRQPWENVTAQIGQIRAAGPYVLVSVLFSSSLRRLGETVSVETYLGLQDRNAHDVDILFLLPETFSDPYAYNNPFFLYNSHYASRLNPQESKQVLLVLQNTSLDQVSSGYFRAFDQTVQY